MARAVVSVKPMSGTAESRRFGRVTVVGWKCVEEEYQEASVQAKLKALRLDEIKRKVAVVKPRICRKATVGVSTRAGAMRENVQALPSAQSQPQQMLLYHSYPTEDGMMVPMPAEYFSLRQTHYLQTRDVLADWSLRPRERDELQYYWESRNQSEFMAVNDIVLPGFNSSVIPRNLHLWAQRPEHWFPH